MNDGFEGVPGAEMLRMVFKNRIQGFPGCAVSEVADS